MTKQVISVREDESLKNVFELMDKHGILGTPVVDGTGVLVGMLTESDLIKPMTTLETPYALNLLGSVMYLENPQDFNDKLKEHCARKVSDLMTKKVISVKKEATLAQVIDHMSEHKVSRLPVVSDDGKLTGIVTRTDVVHEMAKLNK